MIPWRDFFTVDEARAEDVVPTLAARLPAASGGEVVGDDLRDPAIFGADGTRPGHIAAPAPLIHPRLRARIAALLGMTTDEVAAVARYDTCVLDGAHVDRERLATLEHDVIADNGGGAALKRLLVARGRGELAPDVVPVLPPCERPCIVNDAGEAIPGPVDHAYVRLLTALAGHRLYADRDAPCSLRMATWERVQDAFDGLCAAIAGETDPRRAPFALDDAWLAAQARMLVHAYGRPDDTEDCLARLRATLAPAPPEPPLPRFAHYPDPLTPIACRFVGDDAILVVLPHAVAVVDVATGAPRFAAPGTGYDILAVTPTGTHALFIARGDVLASVHALDLRRGDWQDAWGELSPPAFPMGPYKSDAWCMYDYGRRVARPLVDAGNWKCGAVLSPCLRYAWIEDTRWIFRVSDMLPQFDMDALPRVPRAPPPVWWRAGEAPPGVVEPDEEPDEEPVEDEEEDDEDDPRVAFARAADGFRVFRRGTLFARGAARLRLTAPFTAVALDLAGERLLVASPGALEIHTLAGGAPKRIDLAVLTDLVTLVGLRGRMPGLTRVVENRLLAGFGTVDAIRRADVAALTEDRTYKPAAEEAAEIDPTLAAAILAALRGPA